MFTPREVARIQSFPETFRLPGSRSTNYKALGNAVAPVVMWHVTQSILGALKAAEDAIADPLLDSIDADDSTEKGSLNQVPLLALD